MKHWLSVVALGVLAAGGFAPRSHRLCDGFLPPNNMKIPVGDIRALGLGEAQFNAVLDRVEKIYAPIVKQHGGQLVVERRWDDETVNAYANQQGKKWIIHMYGGLARHQAVTADGFALVACHELGHHLGGFPKIGGDWATNEGGADYYSTLKCLRRVLQPKNLENVDPVAKQACTELYKKESEIAQCEAGTMAGVSVSKLLQELGGEPAISLTTPDPAKVETTDDSHPAAQCRLDTYFQGAQCTKKLSEDVSNTDPAPGSCTKAKGYAVGWRPRCWYKPATPEVEMVAAQPLNLVSEKDLKSKLDSLRSALEGGSGR